MCCEKIDIGSSCKYIYRVAIEPMDVISVNAEDGIVSSFLLHDQSGCSVMYDHSMVYDTQRDAIIALIKQLIIELQ